MMAVVAPAGRSVFATASAKSSCMSFERLYRFHASVSVAYLTLTGRPLFTTVLMKELLSTLFAISKGVYNVGGGMTSEWILVGSS
jgi:hypothetical protein